MNLNEKIKILKASVTLDPERKRVLKASMMHRIAAEGVMRERYEATPASVFGILGRSMVRVPVFASLLVLVVASGGVAYAAEDTRPGDILYPVKVNVVEKVAVALAFNDEVRAEREASFAERRLAEAADLAAAGKLTAVLKTDLENRFGGHANIAEARIQKLRTDGKTIVAADVASRFEANLKAHALILDRVSVFTSSTETVTAPFRMTIEKALRDIARARVDVEDELKAASTTPGVAVAADHRIKAATNAINSAKKFIEAKRITLGNDATRDAEEQLSIAERLQAEADEKSGSDATRADAFVIAGKALRAAQEARLLVGTAKQRTFVSSTEPMGVRASPSFRKEESVSEERFRLDHNDDIEDQINSLLKAGL